MRRGMGVLGLWAAVLAVPGEARAQGGADDAVASIEIVGAVTVVKTDDLIFGEHVAGPEVRSTVVGAAARWLVNGVAGTNNYNFVFTLPAALTGPQGSLPIQFGATSAEVRTDAGQLVQAFDPAVPLGASGFGDAFVVTLGSGAGGATGDVVVATEGAAPGVYAGVVTLTVAPY